MFDRMHADNESWPASVTAPCARYPVDAPNRSGITPACVKQYARDAIDLSQEWRHDGPEY